MLTPMLRFFRLAVVSAAFLFWCYAPIAQGAPTSPARRTIAVGEIRPGMKGYGLNVFQGTKPERFNIWVVGILHNFLPKQDIILIRSDDERLKHTGIVAGMSGAPIYIDDRLAGALSYGWQFAKDPIAGVTPIANMLDELDRPLRGPESASLAPQNTFAPPAQAGSLVRVALPLALAGFGAAAFSELARVFEGYHLTAIAAGGTAQPAPNNLPNNQPNNSADNPAPAKLENGSALAISLVRGDMSIAGFGTVTLVEGANILALGHPMLNSGETYLPISTAEIHTVMASLGQSFKMASPLIELGSMVQDRQSGIVGKLGQHAAMIPLRVRVGGPGHAVREFNVEIVRHRFLTPLLAGAVIANATQEAASDVADATVTLSTELSIHGYPPLKLVDQAFSTEGVSSKLIGAAAGIKAIGDIIFNPFAPASLDRIDVQVEVNYKPDVAEITGISMRTNEIEPGTRPALVITLRPYNGPEISETVPLDIPLGLAGATLKIEAAAGNLVKPEQAPPESLGALLDNLRKSYVASSIVVSVQSCDEGLTLRENVLPDLPASVLDTLRPGASTRRGETYKLATRVVVPMSRIITGKRELSVKVKETLGK